MRKKILIIAISIILVVGIVFCIIMVNENSINKNQDNTKNLNKEKSNKNDLPSTEISTEENKDSDNENNNNNNYTINTDIKNSKESNISKTKDKNNASIQENKFNEKTTTTTNSGSNKNQERISATLVYYCLDGWELEETQCIRYTTYSAYVDYTCPQGTKSGSNCIITTQSYVNYTPSSSEYCTAMGYNGSGYYNTCRCQKSGGEYVSNGDCYKTVNTTVPATPSYTCQANFELVNQSCVNSISTSALYKYTCPSGYELSGNECIK